MLSTQIDVLPYASIGANDYVIVSDRDFGTDNVNLKKVKISELFKGIASSYTQTYSTAARTVAAALTDSTGGTASTTAYVAIGGTYSQTEVRNNFATAAAEILALKKLVNALIDDLQAAGIVK